MNVKNVGLACLVVGFFSIAELDGKQRAKKNKAVQVDATEVSTFASTFNSMVEESLKAAEKKIADLFAYFPMFVAAQQTFIQKNSVTPKILCSKCGLKEFSFSEFSGGFLGIVLQRFAEGIQDSGSFDKAKLQLDGFHSLLLQGSPDDIVDFMVRFSNEVKQNCRECHGPSDSWRKIQEK